MLLFLIQCCRESREVEKTIQIQCQKHGPHEIYKDSPCLVFSQWKTVRKMENFNDPSLAVRCMQQEDSEETKVSNRARPGRKCPFLMNWPSKGTIVTFTILSISVILISVILICVRRRQTCEQSSPDVHPFVPDGPACSSGWIGYERKCYFFSDEERNWTSCHSFCISNNSSLAVIKNKPEKVFMLRYKGTAGHWIGLKKDLDHSWKWVDGTELNNTLEVKGEGGDCAFLSSGYAISSQCHVTRRWICSHPDMYTRNMSCQTRS